MKVAVGFDHAGFPLKQTILESIRAAGHEPIDLGTDSEKSVDFPDFSEKVGRAVQSGQAERGVLVCGSGVGACIAANKMQGVWAAICHDTYSARQGVMHDDMNVLCIGARVVGPALAKELVTAFVGAKYQGDEPGGERLARRVAKIKTIESGQSLER